MTDTKSPIDTIQQFISLQNTRKEAAERLGGNQQMSQAKTSADSAIAALMNELSQSGDASKGGVDKDNEFYGQWNNALGRLDEMNKEDKASLFTKMETELRGIYESELQEPNELPQSLKELLQQQMAEIQSA